MKILEFYKSILTLGCLSADEQGLISAQLNGSQVPFMVDSKRMVLPTREHLANPNKKDIVIFHPLSENLLRGESDVMAKYRSAINIRLNYAIHTLILELTVLTLSPGTHSRLKPDQYELLSLLKDADDKTLDAYRNLFKAMPLGNVEKCFVHFFMKKNAMIAGKNHRRGAIVTFPLYEELCKEGTTAFGVKLRKKDHASIKAVLEYLFPKIAEKDTYSRGSLSDTAPTLDALLQGVLGIGSHVNAMVDDYEAVMDDIKALRYDDEWVSVLDNLGQFTNELRLLPMQAGNEGSLEQSNQAPAQKSLTNVAAPAAHMPAPAPAPVYQTLAGPMASNPNAPVVVKTADGKLDFGATLRNNPQMLPAGPAYGMYAPPPPPGPMSARNGRPAWDNPYQQAPAWGAPQMQQTGYGYPQQMGYGVPRI